MRKLKNKAENWPQVFFRLQTKRRTQATLRYYATTRTAFGLFVAASRRRRPP